MDKNGNFFRKNIEKHHWNKKNKWQFERKNPTNKNHPNKTKINRTLKPFSLGGLKPRHRPNAKQRLPTQPAEALFRVQSQGQLPEVFTSFFRPKTQVVSPWAPPVKVWFRFAICKVRFQVSKANGGWEPNSEQLWVVVSHEGPWPSTCDRCPWLWRMMSAWIRRLDCTTTECWVSAR